MARFNFKISLILVFSSILFLVFSVFGTNNALAATLFSDNFNSGLNPSWQIVQGTWTLNSDPLYPEHGNWLVASAPPYRDYEIQIGDFSWTNYELSFDILSKSGTDRNIFFRVNNQRTGILSGHNLPVSYSLQLINEQSYLWKWTNNVPSPLPSSSNHVNLNTISHVVVRVEGPNIKVYLDGNLILNYTDTYNPDAPILNGRIALAAITGVDPSEVWYDNVVITDLAGTPTPVPTPIPTPIPTIGPFEFPFDYPGRLSDNASQFKSAFWDKIRAVFDHTLQTGIHRPFTGNAYSPSDIATCTAGAGCYDSHNGTDFSGAGDQKVFSVSAGRVIYTSSHGSDSCTPESNFGCVVIAKYTGSAYGLFAHLDRIFINQGSNLDSNTQIGEMGATGCTGCLEHLHFGVLKPVKGIKNSILTALMSKKDWQGLLKNINSDASSAAQSFCSYTAPNGAQFNFQDPSGWKGSDKDPWSLTTKKGGCGITSPYLWKYDIGTTP